MFWKFIFFTSVTAEQVTVVAGTNNLTLGGTQYKAKRLVVHPNFDLRKVAGDIGLIEINGTITFNARIGKVSLPSTDVSDANTRVVVSGWGKTWVSGKKNIFLQILNNYFISSAGIWKSFTCIEIFRNKNS